LTHGKVLGAASTHWDATRTLCPGRARRRPITDLNQSDRIDSFFALDRSPVRVGLYAMPNAHNALPATVQLLVLERIDGMRNMARYYVLSIEPTLFGDTAMVREWGRIGNSGQRRTDLYAKHRDARTSLSTWLQRKLKRGYVVRERLRINQPECE
jgi:predicted DNA-binding WGR domain protein